MKDEETAEEYAEVSTKSYKDCLVDIDDISVLREAIADGFLAGLKVGRQDEQLTKAKNLLQKVADVCGYPDYDVPVMLYSEIVDLLKELERK